VKFNKAKLREAIDTAIEHDRVLHERARENVRRRHEEKVADWHQKHDDAWRAFAKLIVERLDAGKVIMQDDLPKNRDSFRGAYTATFDHGERSVGEWKVPPDLEQLAAVLDTIDEDVVTLSGLRTIGFGQGTMNKIVGYLVPVSKS